MRRKINYEKLGSVSTKLQDYAQSLKQIKTKLLVDIDRVQEGYRGKDATMFISRYKEYANSLEVYLTVIDQYAQYFGWLSGNYRDSHGKATNAINSALDTADGVGVDTSATLSLGSVGGKDV